MRSPEVFQRGIAAAHQLSVGVATSRTDFVVAQHQHLTVLCFDRQEEVFLQRWDPADLPV